MNDLVLLNALNIGAGLFLLVVANGAWREDKELLWGLLFAAAAGLNFALVIARHT